ncbi:hypothetical protein U9M48_014145 [Paspalum notatum var. saurae]|uniref:Uncharacterized protein n=1 Tax=Paspalum notatum var. saurae TaxID=547442 RepID=A0AAQ3T1D0_PASNO
MRTKWDETLTRGAHQSDSVHLLLSPSIGTRSRLARTALGLHCHLDDDNDLRQSPHATTLRSGGGTLAPCCFASTCASLAAPAPPPPAPPSPLRLRLLRRPPHAQLALLLLRQHALPPPATMPRARRSGSHGRGGARAAAALCTG